MLKNNKDLGIGRENQRKSKNEIENLKNKKTYQEIMDEQWPKIYELWFSLSKSQKQTQILTQTQTQKFQIYNFFI